MEISNSNLAAFYALAQERNFSRAAHRLSISQPAFSQRILNLESQLLVTLVIRNKKRIELTPAGEQLLKFCELNRQIEEEFLSDLKLADTGILSGTLRIGGFSSVMRSILLPALAPLLRNHPQVNLQTYTEELSDLLTLHRESRVDFILHTQKASTDSLVSEFLGYEENVLVSSLQHSSLDIYLDHDENDVTTSAYFALAKTKAPKNKRYLGDVYGLLDGVRLGLGKAVLPRHLLDAEHFRIEKPTTTLRVPVYLIFRQSPYHTRLQTLATQTICRHFRKLLKQR